MHRSLLVAGVLAFGIGGGAATAIAHAVGEPGAPAVARGALPDFAAIDADGDGVIGKEEFVDAMLGRMRARLEQRFDRIDADADGTVTVADLDAARAATIERFRRRSADCGSAPAAVPDAAPADPDAGP